MHYVGDVHGKTSQLIWMMKHGKLKDRKVFQLGDMGLGFKGVELPEQDSLLFIRGNHDNPQKCQEHPNYAGEYGYIADEKLFFLGGAWSIDAAWRIEGLSWWRDEEQSIEALNAAHQLYIESKPEIVATHEAPTKAAITMLSGLLLDHETRLYTWSPTDASNPKGIDYEYYKEKTGCVNTRTSQALQQMFEIHRPKHWIFGHYHIPRDFEIDGTWFHCLPELDVLELGYANL